ncbi:hypothetical protein C8R44DRAFT_822618 [Mycena epipterygia]|nr:hypothetical protein C8R44DRAFT_822618 [Mycena epipterygia]
MPLGQKGGRRSRELPGITAPLPQELIDAIIDEFDISLTAPNNSRAFPDRDALRACALAARAFVRPSQMKLFSTVNLFAASYDQHPDERSGLFSELLSPRSYIGLYVRQLVLSYRNARSDSVVHILSCLSKLQALCLHPWADHLHYENPPVPIHLKDAFLAAFSLPSLRRLELRDHGFKNPQELESMLSSSVGLKELTLRSIQFTDLSLPAPNDWLQAPRVVLDSLTVFAMPIGYIDAVLNTFTIVDITHLRSVSCDRHPKSLLQANSHSIREFTLTLRSRLDILYPDALDQILPADSSLYSLSLRVYTHATLIIKQQLRNLANFKILKRVTLTVPNDRNTAELWLTLDSVLEMVNPQLDAIEIHLGRSEFPKPDAAGVRRLLPALDSKGSLHISSIPPGDDSQY